MVNKLMEYEELYKWGVSELKQANILEAELDARLLLEEVCNTDRHYLFVHGIDPVEESLAACYRSFIGKRKIHVPLQQITGYQEFMGLRFTVTPDVLIPRQDTETLVEEALRVLHDKMKILDLCTGSGCILLSLLHYSNECEGTGTDLSEKALAVAAENAVQLHLDAELVHSDLFKNVTGKFDMIISNPPYIPAGVIFNLMEEVRDFEPLMALDGKEDGLHFYREILKEAGNYLYTGGILLFEIGCEQAADVCRLMEEAGFRQINVCKDLAGLNRVVSGIYGG